MFPASNCSLPIVKDWKDHPAVMFAYHFDPSDPYETDVCNP